MVNDPFSYSARWDSIGLDCAFCKFFGSPKRWPDSQQEVFCNKHRVSLRYRLSTRNYLDGEWFCKHFENNGRAFEKAVSEFESIRKELDDFVIYGGYSNNGYLKEVLIKDLRFDQGFPAQSGYLPLLIKPFHVVTLKEK